MQLVDPRLSRYAQEARRYLGITAALGLGTVAALVAQAVLTAYVIDSTVSTRPHLASVRGLIVPILLLALVFLARAGLAWLTRLAGRRTSAAVESRLRMAMLEHVVRLGPRWLSGQRSGELGTLAIRGLEGVDTYFTRYVPSVLLAVLVPAATTLALVAADWPSGLAVLATLPLLPLLARLLDRAMRERAERQGETLRTSAHHFLDLLAGLGTLTAFGRSKAQIGSLERMSSRQSDAGRASARVGALGGLGLELVTVFGVSVVAVIVGLRTLSGTLDLRSALIVLLLAPEAYRPLRRAFTSRQASAEGLEAAERVFGILAAPARSDGQLAVPAPDPGRATTRLDNVTLVGDDRSNPLLHRVSMELEPGRFTGIVGPSGAGKSTLLSLLAAVVRPDRGTVTIGGVDLATVETMSWRARVGWLPQEPTLFAGSVAENIALGLATMPEDRTGIEQAARAAAVDVPLDRMVTEGGRDLSAGQRRRIALARALVGDPDLLLLDEPTESVDAETEAAVFEALRAGRPGRTVVVVTHRPALLQLCHHVVRLEPSRAKPDPEPLEPFDEPEPGPGPQPVEPLEPLEPAEPVAASRPEVVRPVRLGRAW